MGDRYLTKKGDSNSQRVTAQAESRNSEEMDRPFKIDNNIYKSHGTYTANIFNVPRIHKYQIPIKIALCHRGAKKWVTDI